MWIKTVSFYTSTSLHKPSNYLNTIHSSPSFVHYWKLIFGLSSIVTSISSITICNQKYFVRKKVCLGNLYFQSNLLQFASILIILVISPLGSCCFDITDARAGGNIFLRIEVKHRIDLN